MGQSRNISNPLGEAIIMLLLYLLADEKSKRRSELVEHQGCTHTKDARLTCKAMVFAVCLLKALLSHRIFRFVYNHR